MAVNNVLDVASTNIGQMEDMIASGGKVDFSSMPMSFEDQLQQLKDDCFLELHDVNDQEFNGIEATDVTSLLDQFEEVSSSFADVNCYPVDLDGKTRTMTSIKRKESKASEVGPKSELVNCQNPSPLLLNKLRNSSKRKSTIMLPLETTSPKMEARTIKVNLKWPKDRSIQKSGIQKAANTDPNNKKTATEVNKTMQSKNGIDMNENFYECIGDHNSYCLRSPQYNNSKCPGNSETLVLDSSNVVTSNLGKRCAKLDANANNDKSSPHHINLEIEEGEIVDSNDTDSKQTMFKRQSITHRKRQFRKREESPEADVNYCDKIPHYFTGFTSTSKKRKVNSSLHTSTGAITVEDFMECDPSPSRDTSSMYSKLPAYHSCFTNSSKFDSSISSQESNQDKYAWDRVRGDQLSMQSSSRSQSPLIVDVERVSSSRSPSRSRCRSRSIPKAYSMSRSRQRSYSSNSRSSSSDCSSRSRSRSSHRRSRRRYSRRQHRRLSSASSRSYSSCSSRSSYRSRSRSYDRYRSRSRSLSESREERRKELQQLRQAEKEQQMTERRIVYVGRIPNDYTRKQLRQRFSRFGDIEEVSVHFRDDGDNYGFVTFSYTCDAYAAIEKGNSFESEEKFDLCFGGRRKFCKSEYADLDGNKETEEDFYPVFQRKEVCDFDALLKQVKTLAGKK